MTKTERQEIGVQYAERHNFIGTLNYSLRFGKTLTGIKIINRLKYNKNIKSVVILVPNSNLRLQWTNEIDEHIFGLKVLIYTANSALNQDSLECDLLIVDEIHKFTSDARILLLNGNKIKHTYRIGLTGTYPENESNNTNIIYKFYPIIDTITEEEAIINNWISDYIEYNYGLDLPDYDKDKYIKYSKFIGEVLNDFKGIDEYFTYSGKRVLKDHYQAIVSCRVGLSINKYLLNSDKSEYIPSAKIREYVAKQKGWYYGIESDSMINRNWSPTAIENKVNMFEDFVQKRNQLINNNQVKLEAVLNIVEKFKDKIIIIFNQSIDFADKLTDAINANFGNIAICYHSKVSSRPLLDEHGNYYKYKTGNKKGEIKIFGQKSLKDNAIAGIKCGFYKVLVTVMALDEGFNVEDMEIAITTSGTTNPIQHKQRTGRVKTLSPYRKKETLVINLFFQNFNIEHQDGTINIVRSRDQTKLRLRQRQSENLIYWVENIEDIS